MRRLTGCSDVEPKSGEVGDEGCVDVAAEWRVHGITHWEKGERRRVWDGPAIANGDAHPGLGSPREPALVECTPVDRVLEGGAEVGLRNHAFENR